MLFDLTFLSVIRLDVETRDVEFSITVCDRRENYFCAVSPATRKSTVTVKETTRKSLDL